MRRKALFLAEGTLLIARKLRRKEEIALAMRAKANALYASGDNHGAVQHHEDAFKLYEALGIPKEAARTLSNSIQPLILLGEYDRALAASERAREIFTRIGENAAAGEPRQQRRKHLSPPGSLQGSHRVLRARV